MNKLTLEIIKKQEAPLKHLDNLELLRSFGEGLTEQNMLLFLYGRIVGIQEERAKRNKKVVEVPVLIEDGILQLQKTFHDRLNGAYTSSEIEEAFNNFKDIYHKENNAMLPYDIGMVLKAVIALEKIERNKIACC